MIFKCLVLAWCCLLPVAACAGHQPGTHKRPPSDPIASTSAAELRTKGLALANAGDLIRAQQYLAAAHLKGIDGHVIIPELIWVCLAGSRLRTALVYAEPYLKKNPNDIPMRKIVATIHNALGSQRPVMQSEDTSKGQEVMEVYRDLH